MIRFMGLPTANPLTPGLPLLEKVFLIVVEVRPHEPGIVFPRRSLEGTEIRAIGFAALVEIRTEADPDFIAGSVRGAVHSVDQDLPVASFATLATLVDTSLTADRFAMLLLAAFGILALILSAIGM
jgi:hypothetical protein